MGIYSSTHFYNIIIYNNINGIKKLTKKKNIKLDLILTGSHNSKKFGNTKKEAKENNIKNFYTLKIPDKNENSTHLSLSSSVLLRKLSQKFKKKKYDCIIVLGDRYEIMSAVIAANFHQIPVAHIGGGDTTLGAVDECIRH